MASLLLLGIVFPICARSPPVQPLPFSAGGVIPSMVFPSPINSFESGNSVATAVRNFSVIINDNGINDLGGNCSREGVYQSQQAAAYKAAAKQLGKHIGVGVYRQGSQALSDFSESTPKTLLNDPAGSKK